MSLLAAAAWSPSSGEAARVTDPALLAGATNAVACISAGRSLEPDPLSPPGYTAVRLHEVDMGGVPYSADDGDIRDITAKTRRWAGASSLPSMPQARAPAIEGTRQRQSDLEADLSPDAEFFSERGSRATPERLDQQVNRNWGWLARDLMESERLTRGDPGAERPFAEDERPYAEAVEEDARPREADSGRRSPWFSGARDSDYGVDEATEPAAGGVRPEWLDSVSPESEPLRALSEGPEIGGPRAAEGSVPLPREPEGPITPLERYDPGLPRREPVRELPLRPGSPLQPSR